MSTTEDKITFSDIEVACNPNAVGRATAVSERQVNLRQYLFGAPDPAWLRASKNASKNAAGASIGTNTTAVLGFLKNAALSVHQYARLHIDANTLAKRHVTSGSLSEEDLNELHERYKIARGFIRLLVEEIHQEHPKDFRDGSPVSVGALLITQKGIGTERFGESRGVVAELTVSAVRGGDGSLYPEPAYSMIELRDGFQESIDSAKSCLEREELWDNTIDICWSLRPQNTELSTQLIGGSAGLAFAMAMGKLLAGRKGHGGD